MRKRFFKTFSIAVIIGLLYGFAAIWLQNICITNDIFHLEMNIDDTIDLLELLFANTVLIYGFFSAFLLYIITEIPKISDEANAKDEDVKKLIKTESKRYKKMIADKMNIYIWLTGFVADFFFFFTFSIIALELQKRTGDVYDCPVVASAYALYFIFIVALLGFLVFSLVMGAITVGDHELE